MPRGRPRNPAAAAPATRRGRANHRPQVPFTYKVVLNQWLLWLFNVKRFEELAEHLRNKALEGLEWHALPQHVLGAGCEADESPAFAEAAPPARRRNLVD